MAVYDLDRGMTGVRRDSTTACGYHTPTEEGVMQFGRSRAIVPACPN